MIEAKRLPYTGRRFALLTEGDKPMQPIRFPGFEIEIIRKRIRRINLHVTPEKVWMSIPYRVSRESAEQFARMHQDWILKQRAQLVRLPAEQGTPVADGMQLRLWGQTLRLYVVHGDGAPGLRKEAEALYLTVPQGAGDAQKQAQLHKWFQDELKQALPEVCERWEAVTGRRASGYYIRDMKTRWGSCSLKTGRICINQRLIHEEPACLDYVIAHELTHLYVPNHGPGFWRLMDQFYPNWREIRRKMRK